MARMSVQSLLNAATTQLKQEAHNKISNKLEADVQAAGKSARVMKAGIDTLGSGERKILDKCAEFELNQSSHPAALLKKAEERLIRAEQHLKYCKELCGEGEWISYDVPEGTDMSKTALGSNRAWVARYPNALRDRRRAEEDLEQAKGAFNAALASFEETLPKQ